MTKEQEAMKMPTDRCPKCGGISGFTMNRKTGGWWKSYCTWDGIVEDTSLDDVIVSPYPKTVICDDCGKRVPNPLRTSEGDEDEG